MRWPAFSERGTVERRLFYFRYADPDAVQIYQGFALTIVSLFLFLGQTALLGDEVAALYAAWSTVGYYALGAMALSWACLVIDPKSGNNGSGVVLLGTCAVYWGTMGGELFARFGFAPLSHGLVTFMILMALYGFYRLLR